MLFCEVNTPASYSQFRITHHSVQCNVNSTADNFTALFELCKIISDSLRFETLFLCRIFYGGLVCFLIRFSQSRCSRDHTLNQRIGVGWRVSRIPSGWPGPEWHTPRQPAASQSDSYTVWLQSARPSRRTRLVIKAIIILTHLRPHSNPASNFCGPDYNWSLVLVLWHESGKHIVSHNRLIFDPEAHWHTT